MSPHFFIHVTRMGPLPASPPIRVFTLLIPFACCRPSTSPKLATIEVAVKEPKEVDETVLKMASHKPPVKHLSSGGSSTCQASVGAERADVQLTPSTGIVSPSSSTTLKSRSLYFLHFTCCLSVISGCLQTLWTTEGSAGVVLLHQAPPCWSQAINGLLPLELPGGSHSSFPSTHRGPVCF